jgi:hypothetical protein
VRVPARNGGGTTRGSSSEASGNTRLEHDSKASPTREGNSEPAQEGVRTPERDIGLPRTGRVVRAAHREINRRTIFTMSSK